MSDGQRVTDVYATKQAFSDMLDRATENSKGAWESEFVENIREKWDQFGMEMFLSDKQDETLHRIAGA